MVPSRFNLVSSSHYTKVWRKCKWYFDRGCDTMIEKGGGEMEPVRILYRDEAMAVCVKPQGAASQADGAGSMPALLEAALGVEQVWPVHRLDQAAGGVMVYGLTARAAAALSRAVQAGQLEKTYLALVRGTPDPAAGTWEDLLYHDQRRNKTFVVTRQRKGVKAARLAYRVLASDGEQSLVEVRLFT